jgi:hypothetical protein
MFVPLSLFGFMTLMAVPISKVVKKGCNCYLHMDAINGRKKVKGIHTAMFSALFFLIFCCYLLLFAALIFLDIFNLNREEPISHHSTITLSITQFRG